jgi:hypothetical protein
MTSSNCHQWYDVSNPLPRRMSKHVVAIRDTQRHRAHTFLYFKAISRPYSDGAKRNMGCHHVVAQPDTPT